VTKIVVATVPLTGHVQPMLLVVRALVARGHDVIWYAASKFRPAIEKTGAAFAPMHPSLDWDDADIEAALPALQKRRGLARVKAQLIHMFILPMEKQLRDLEALVQQHAPAVVLADSAHLGAALVSETQRLPWATLGISALVVPSIDTAPFGPGWRPSSSRLGRWRNRFLNWLVFRCMFRKVNQAYQRSRVAAGLSSRTSYFEVLSPYLYLQPTVPAFEYTRADLAAQIRFIGPLVPQPSANDSALPSWWADVEAAHHSGTPVVMITQGTLATDASELIVPALRGLAALNMLVIVTTTQLLAPTDVPGNARIATFIPYHLAMPLLAAVVTNGGYGGVQMALRYGVPLVVAGGSEEKPEIAARVAWCGAGIDLRTGRPSPVSVAAAVTKVLSDAQYKTRAAEIAQQMQHHDAPNEAAALIEQLVAHEHRAER
jgi:MGT family glycosyltransferase